MKGSLTEGPITKSMLLFAFPMMVGNLLQQCYNIADTLIVGRFLGADALAAVGSAYSLMTFLTSILLGLSMGSGAVFSLRFGERNFPRLRASVRLSFWMIAAFTVVLNAVMFAGLEWFLVFMQTPEQVLPLMRDYLWVIFWGLVPVFLYNYFASLLRAVGDSRTPLLFLGISAVLNIGLDLFFVLTLRRGVAGAAEATVISQIVSGVGITVYALLRLPWLRTQEKDPPQDRRGLLWELFQFSSLTCLQQSVMNFGILLVQGLVNSFGAGVMAAFAAAVKIDSFAYMPVQDFGNAFSTFIAQNYGAGKHDRIRRGLKSAILSCLVFCLIISAAVWIFAEPLLTIFIDPAETEILAIGVGYLRIEGAFYCGIGLLFLCYGFFRAVKRPGISVVLTVISLGTRVLLAYVLSAIPAFGVTGIWWSVPIGWALADLAGLFFYRRQRAERR
ncbi:MAG TPA: MATE family efflux transporter [Candidatus Gallacutalibacter pullicola]|uniref:Probable multidrug resistance protein NorM n=1 Tax=Candidatus Gallacutalibacter pullicola TaxID=2840830 RepID=A0A9D1DP38_9FIRM|nr:MATE family efflux transporter [Candidatus Gallacutalibacter pullicola]